MFQFPRLAFVSYVFRNKYLLVISAIPNTHANPHSHENKHKHSKLQISKVGCPIRKFTDQSLFAAPHGLSQRTTSFIASQRQGIHRIPLRHLIALIVDARRGLSSPETSKIGHRSERPANFMDAFVITAASMRPRSCTERRLRHLFTI